MEGELARMLSEIYKFGSGTEKNYAPHCLSGLSTLKVHYLGQFEDDLERFAGLSFIDERPFEQLNALIEKCSSMKSRSPSTRMHDTVKILNSTLDSLQKLGSDVHGIVADASVFRNS